MKKFCLLLSVFILWGVLCSTAYAQQQKIQQVSNAPAEKEDNSRREFSNNPTDLLKKMYRESNDDKGNKVQATRLDNVNSNHCDEIGVGGEFTIYRTICSIKYAIRSYLQYIMYIWLVGATIFIIRNWFKIVTATDKDGQIKKFKENMINIIIWVVLLTSFYFILEAFVSVVNFIVGDN